MTATTAPPADRGKITKELVTDCPVRRVKPHPRNARDHDREAIRESLLTNAEFKPIVAQRSTGHIISGNGRYLVAVEELGWTNIDVLLVDVDDARALAILAADNKVGEKSGYHTGPLAALLTEIAEQYGTLEGTGYDQDEFEDIMAALADQGEQALAEYDVNPSGPPPVLEEVPSTDAGYAETAEEEAERAERKAAQTPPSAQGVQEVVLVYPAEDKVEFGNLVAAARQVLGSDLRASDICLRGLRVLAAVLDSRHESAPLEIGSLLKHAGLDHDDDG